MVEQVKKWFQAFSTSNLITSRDTFEDYICDGCEEEIVRPENDCLWTGQAFGMCDYTICPNCYERGQYNNKNQCDFIEWEMFQLSNEEIEKFKANWIEPEEIESPFSDQIKLTREQKLTLAIDQLQSDWRAEGLSQCQKFDLGEGWYRRSDADEDLCQYHSRLIISSSGLDQSKFKMITNQDLNQITLSNEAKYVHYEVGRGGVFLCQPCQLVLPTCISTEDYLEINQDWFGIENWMEEEQLVPIGWESLVSCNGISHSNMSDKFIMLDPEVGNIAQWVPFDESTDPVGLEGSDGGFALVNCNPQSLNYLQTLTIIFDNHGRSSADLTGLTIEEYLKQKQSYLSQINLTLPEAIVHEVYSCDVCQTQPIIGKRYKCCSREDICADCYSTGKRCNFIQRENNSHRIEDQKWHPLDFIEHLRQKLNQGFYYG